MSNNIIPPNSITIRDAATFVGELYYIIGTQDDAKVRIQTDAYGIVKCDTTRTLGKALREYLFDRVKVSGRGTWRQVDNGLWDIETFTITDFAPVKAESLREAVENVRAANIQWPAKLLEEISKINND